jgi:hypothetical protein
MVCAKIDFQNDFASGSEFFFFVPPRSAVHDAEAVPAQVQSDETAARVFHAT